MGISLVYLILLTGVGAEAVCPEWQPFSSSRYCFLNETLPWHNAATRCADVGGGLALPQSESEQGFIWDMVMRARGEAKLAWIDCFYDSAEGAWMQANGDRCDFANWNPREPRNYDQRCATMWYRQWSDYKCRSRYFAVCVLQSADASSALGPVEDADDPDRESRLGDFSDEPSAGISVAEDSANDKRATPSIFCLRTDADGRLTSKCLTGHVLKEVRTTKGVVACGSACREEPQCRSFNLRQDSRGEMICQLNSITRSEADDENKVLDKSCYYFEI